MVRERGGANPRPKGEAPLRGPESGITGRRALERFLDVPGVHERNIRIMAAGIEGVLVGDLASRSLLVASEGQGTTSEVIRRYNERSRLLRQARLRVMQSPQLRPRYLVASREFTRQVAAVYLLESDRRAPQATHHPIARTLGVVADASLNIVKDFREIE